LSYYEVRIANLDPSELDDNEKVVAATIHYQAIERELIGLGYLKPAGLVEAQPGLRRALAWVASAAPEAERQRSRYSGFIDRAGEPPRCKALPLMAAKFDVDGEGAGEVAEGDAVIMSSQIKVLMTTLI
jgi:hypothetical protein